jgi:hypothetical protein
MTVVAAFADRAFGLVIGISQFTDARYASVPLPHALNDANDFASTLEHSLGWRADHILTLAGSVTKDAVFSAFRRIGAQVHDCGDAELFLLYISTHGHPYASVRRPYDVALLTTDTSLADQLSITETALTRYRLGPYIDTVPARQKAIIVDACYAASAAASEDLVPFESHDLDAALLASSTRRAFAQTTARNSQFTATLLEGVRRMAGRSD